MERTLKALAASSNPILKINGLAGLANNALMRGRISDLERYATQARQQQQALGQPPNALLDSLQVSQLDLGFYDDTVRALRRMDALFARTDFSSMPSRLQAWPAFYASAGQPARARSILARWEAAVDDSVNRRLFEPSRRGAQAAIALAERRYDDALRDVWAADTTYDGPNGNCAICIYDDVASVYSRAGKPDSAIIWFEKYLATPYFSRQSFDAARPLILKRLGELYETTGNTREGGTSLPRIPRALGQTRPETSAEGG